MKKSVLFLACFVACALAYAEPDSNIRWAMKTPVSLFDLGIYRFGEQVKARAKVNPAYQQVLQKFDEQPLTVNYVMYDWDNNEIIIAAVSLVADQTQQSCIELLRGFHLAVLGFALTANPEDYTREQIAILLPAIWDHPGAYRDADTPDDYIPRLVDRMVVEYSLHFDSDAITCRSKLGSNKVSVTLPEE